MVRARNIEQYKHARIERHAKEMNGGEIQLSLRIRADDDRGNIIIEETTSVESQQALSQTAQQLTRQARDLIDQLYEQHQELKQELQTLSQFEVRPKGVGTTFQHHSGNYDYKDEYVEVIVRERYDGDETTLENATVENLEFDVYDGSGTVRFAFDSVAQNPQQALNLVQQLKDEFEDRVEEKKEREHRRQQLEDSLSVLQDEE